MKRTVRRSLLVLAEAATALTTAPPASATVHEIVGQWCSGRDALAPPGVSGGSSDGNVARPLFANGFIGDPVPFDPPGVQPAGLILPFDFDHPASKVVGTGVYVPIGEVNGSPLYIVLIEADPDFSAFRHCPRLAG